MNPHKLQEFILRGCTCRTDGAPCKFCRWVATEPDIDPIPNPEYINE